MVKVATLSLALCLLLLAACGPAQLLEAGRPEDAFEHAAKRLERDPSGGRQLVDVLTRAYELSQGNAAAAIARLTADGADPYGERRADLWAAARERRTRMEALRLGLLRVVYLPAWDAEPDYAAGYAAAAREATTLLTAAADQRTRGARSGDRFAARAAHDFLQRRRRYATDPEAFAALEAEMADIGTLRVAYSVVSGSAYHGRQLARRLSARWVTLAPASQRAGDWADLYVSIDVDAWPTLDVDEVCDRQRYERTLTRREKVGTDTLGQAIYETVEEEIEATVVTVRRHYRATAPARIRVWLPDGTGLASRRFCGSATAEHVTVDVSGDKRALVGKILPRESFGTFGLLDEHQLKDAALEDVGDEVPWISLDGLYGSRPVAMAE